MYYAHEAKKKYGQLEQLLEEQQQQERQYRPQKQNVTNYATSKKQRFKNFSKKRYSIVNEDEDENSEGKGEGEVESENEDHEVAFLKVQKRKKKPTATAENEEPTNGYHLIIFVFFSCAFVFCLTFSVPLFRWLEYDGCCVCFFDFSLFSLSLVPLTRSH